MMLVDCVPMHQVGSVLWCRLILMLSKTRAENFADTCLANIELKTLLTLAWRRRKMECVSIHTENLPKVHEVGR